jgi:hypothetical protein
MACLTFLCFGARRKIPPLVLNEEDASELELAVATEVLRDITSRFESALEDNLDPDRNSIDDPTSSLLDPLLSTPDEEWLLVLAVHASSSTTTSNPHSIAGSSVAV